MNIKLLSILAVLILLVGTLAFVTGKSLGEASASVSLEAAKNAPSRVVRASAYAPELAGIGLLLSDLFKCKQLELEVSATNSNNDEALKRVSDCYQLGAKKAQAIEAAILGNQNSR